MLPTRVDDSTLIRELQRENAMLRLATEQVNATCDQLRSDKEEMVVAHRADQLAQDALQLQVNKLQTQQSERNNSRGIIVQLRHENAALRDKTSEVTLKHDKLLEETKTLRTSNATLRLELKRLYRRNKSGDGVSPSPLSSNVSSSKQSSSDPPLESSRRCFVSVRRSDVRPSLLHEQSCTTDSGTEAALSEDEATNMSVKTKTMSPKRKRRMSVNSARHNNNNVDHLGNNETMLLSNELMLLILLRAGYMAMGTVAQVCRRWNKLSRHRVILSNFGQDIRFTKYTRGFVSPQTFGGHTESVYALTVDNDGTLFSGSEDATIKVWSGAGALLQSVTPHQDTIYALELIHGRTHTTGTHQHQIVDHHDSNEKNALDLQSFYPWNSRVYSVSGDKTLCILSNETDEIQTETTTSKLSNDSDDASLTINASLIVNAATHTTTSDNTHHHADVRVPLEKRKVCEGHSDVVYAVAIAPDGRIYTASFDKTIKIWTPNGTFIQTLCGHTEGIRALAIAPDGRVYSGDWTGAIRIWSPLGVHLQTLKGHEGVVRAIVIAPCGRVYSGSWDRTINIWSKNGELLRTLTDHTGGIRALALGVQGRLVSGSRDKTVRIWSYDGDLLHTLRGHTDWVSAVATGRDGKIYSGCRDSKIIVW